MESNTQVQFSSLKSAHYFLVQLVPAPQYAQYMSQQPAVDAVAPVPLDEQVVDLQNSQIQEDEKLARQLQAQFNQ